MKAQLIRKNNEKKKKGAATMNTEFSVTYRHLRFAACAYVGLPVLVFLGGFLKWYFALPSIFVLCFAYYRTVTADNIEKLYQHETILKPSAILGMFVFTLLWTYLGGMNGFWYQSADWNCRNPVYFDLIEFDWPVIYERNGNALCYYIGHWLPPALFSKMIYALTGSFEWGRMIGRMALWCWSSVGLTLVILLIIHFLKIEGKKRRFFAILVLVFFSGMDIVGSLFTGKLSELMQPYFIHLEWWNGSYQFSSITTCVYFVFNQTIVPWIIVLCFMMEEDACSYVYYGTACLLCGPFPLVGIAICMLIKAACYCATWARKDNSRDAWRKIFSLSNVLMVLFVFPFVASYIVSNNAASEIGAAQNAASQSAAMLPRFFTTQYWNKELLLFLALEVGIYLLLIFHERRRDPVYYAIILIAMIAPYFKVGKSSDFCMRTSVPAVFILMLYVSDYLQKHFTLHPKSWRQIGLTRFACQISAFALAICFCLGAVTAGIEVYRGFYHVFTRKTIRLEDMSIGTFNQETIPYNFRCINPDETLFFGFFAK